MNALSRSKPLRLSDRPYTLDSDPWEEPPEYLFGPLAEPCIDINRLQKITEHILHDAGRREKERTMAEQAPVIRCKVVCGNTLPALDQDGKKIAESVALYAVYSNTEENKAWSQATPSASFQLYISNPGAWGKLERGKEYYVDFTPAVEAAS